MTKITCTLQVLLYHNKKTKAHHLTYACLIYYPPLKDHIVCACPSKSLVYSCQVHLSRPKLRRSKLDWTLCFQGGVDVAMAHSEREAKGHPIQYEYMSDFFFFIMLQLERYKTLTMLGLSIFTPVVLRTRALLIFILVIK